MKTKIIYGFYLTFILVVLTASQPILPDFHGAFFFDSSRKVKKSLLKGSRKEIRLIKNNLDKLKCGYLEFRITNDSDNKKYNTLTYYFFNDRFVRGVEKWYYTEDSLMTLEKAMVDFDNYIKLNYPVYETKNVFPAPIYKQRITETISSFYPDKGYSKYGFGEVEILKIIKEENKYILSFSKVVNTKGEKYEPRY